MIGCGCHGAMASHDKGKAEAGGAHVPSQVDVSKGCGFKES